MRILIFILLFFCLASRSEAQSDCFTLDSIPKKQIVKVVLNPTQSNDVFHSFEIIRISKEEYYIIYSAPTIWAGHLAEEHDGLVITGEFRHLIDHLLCSGVKWYPTREFRRFQRTRGGMPYAAFVHNDGADPSWALEYQQIEELLFGAFIQNQYRIQSDYLSNLKNEMIGCYVAFGNEVVALHSSDLQLVRQKDLNNLDPDKCYWFFLPDLVLMTGPCYSNIEMTYHWEFIHGFQEVQICINPDRGQEYEQNKCAYSFFLEESVPSGWRLSVRSQYSCE